MVAKMTNPTLFAIMLDGVIGCAQGKLHISLLHGVLRRSGRYHYTVPYPSEVGWLCQDGLLSIRVKHMSASGLTSVF